MEAPYCFTQLVAAWRTPPLGMCTTKFQLLELRLLTSSNWNLAPQGLVECAWGTEGPGGHPSGPREQKNEQQSNKVHLVITQTVGGDIAP